ncbi:Utp11l: putative U3 small nucleolar RNA-associated protein 11 [Crotalus adamanteus]|uniref:U3 small nucleolar RNA-associated protein 11 n=1 Tax=Crotalus adamanteus TaxID=8729 RepID=A0AAW1AZ87_CROAD
MAAFTKAAKSRQRQHLERGQVGSGLASRRALGLLEKKDDYRLRAADFHKKRDALRALRRRAQEKNPDEFYFRMTRERLQDGAHVLSQQEEDPPPEQQKLLKTQDLKYVEMKRAAEVQGFQQANKPHPGAGRDGMQGFDVALHLNTAPELVSRVYNRPTLETLKRNAVSGITTDGQLQGNKFGSVLSVGANQLASAMMGCAQERLGWGAAGLDSPVAGRLARQRKGQYSLLKQRIERERKMFVIAQKLQTRKDLLDKTERVKLKKETVNQPAIYRFQFRRKR